MGRWGIYIWGGEAYIWGGESYIYVEVRHIYMGRWGIYIWWGEAYIYGEVRHIYMGRWGIYIWGGEAYIYMGRWGIYIYGEVRHIYIYILGSELQLHSFLTSALDGGEWLTSRSGRFTPGKEPRYPVNRRLAGLWVYILELDARSVQRTSTRKYVPSRYCLYRVCSFKTKVISSLVFPFVFFLRVLCYDQLLHYFRSVVWRIATFHCIHFIYTHSLFCSVHVIYRLFLGCCIFTVELRSSMWRTNSDARTSTHDNNLYVMFHVAIRIRQMFTGRWLRNVLGS
jgi:hypothetical protein